MKANDFMRLLLVTVIVILVSAWGGRLTRVYKLAGLKSPASSPTPTVDPCAAVGTGPVINAMSTSSATVGTRLVINGCNFNGFEGDLQAWMEDNKGIRALLPGEEGSTPRVLKVTLKSLLCETDNSYSGKPCVDWFQVVPGKYKLYVETPEKKSNEVEFIVK